MLGDMVVDAQLSISTKLLICLVSNKFDNFTGQMEKVTVTLQKNLVKLSETIYRRHRHSSSHESRRLGA